MAGPVYCAGDAFVRNSSTQISVSLRNLDRLFAPRSVAVIGASNRPRSVGATVMRNLLSGGFAGAVLPVNPKHAAVAGVHAYATVSELPAAPDLAVVCTPAAAVPGVIAELGAAGTKAAVVLTAGLAAGKDAEGRTLQQAMLDAARPHLLRVLGPNCVGLLIPGLGLNASFAHTTALPGNLAFVSQSGALTTAVLDWARTRGIGFSHFISLGDCADVDFGDVIDYLGSDPKTGAILLYMESVSHARKFMSAARAAARNKPVIAVKAGRAAEGARAAASHTGALAGSDEVFDTALRRAGILRVGTTQELFDAVETLARAKPLGGERLAIVTNGGGPGVMAVDALMRSGGTLAPLAGETLAQLDSILPPTWSRANPVDLIGDAPGERYVRALELLLADEQTDAVLLLHAPTAIVPSEEIAAACAPLIREARRNVLACWLGGEGVARARGIFAEAGIPTYATPEEAVQAFLQMVEYRRSQEMLMEVPATVTAQSSPDADKARAVVTGALAAGRSLLDETEAKAILAAYGVPVVQTRVAASAEEAARIALEFGFPVAVKLFSPDVSHKSDLGGVELDLQTADAVLRAAAGIATRLEELRPGARLAGFTVQPMVRRPGAHELIVGAATDPIFGPVVLFGHGGTAVEVIADRAMALPPLNVPLARELISRTRVSKLLAGYRDRRPADLGAISLVLMQVSQMIADLPEIAELDINPLLADEGGVVALDARMRVAPAAAGRSAERLAIRPYPKDLEEPIQIDGRRILLRPVRPEDGPRHRAFLETLDPEDSRMRFFHWLRELPRSECARLTQIDYDREMAIIAEGPAAGSEREYLGEARMISDPDNLQAELGIVVRSDLKGKGLGERLLDKIIRYARSRGTRRLVGQVRADNARMLSLAQKFGFEFDRSSDDALVTIALDLKTAQVDPDQ